MPENTLHLVNEIPYTVTLCGKSLSSVGDSWTDDFAIIGDSDFATCPTCAKRGKAIMRQTNDSWRQEIAMEAGMLHGIDAYNEARGY